MICSTCHGTGYVLRDPRTSDTSIPHIVMTPCPDCHCGHAHCCDGLTAENDVEENDDL